MSPRLHTLLHPIRTLRLRHVPWSWCLCVTVLLVLGLFLTGHHLFGLSDELSALMALLGLLLAPLLTLVIFPIIALTISAFAALAAAVVFLLTPLIAALTAAWGWLLATAFGQAVIAPIYSLLAPLVLKIAPFLTTGKFAGKGWRWMMKKLKRPAKNVRTNGKPRRT